METPTEIIKTKKSIEPYNKFVDNVAKDLIEQKQLRDEEPEEEDYIETNEIIPQEENIKRFNNFDDLLNEVMGNMKQQKILKDKDLPDKDEREYYYDQFLNQLRILL